MQTNKSVYITSVLKYNYVGGTGLNSLGATACVMQWPPGNLPHVSRGWSFTTHVYSSNRFLMVGMETTSEEC